VRPEHASNGGKQARMEQRMHIHARDYNDILQFLGLIFRSTTATQIATVSKLLFPSSPKWKVFRAFLSGETQKLLEVWSKRRAAHREIQNIQNFGIRDKKCESSCRRLYCGMINAIMGQLTSRVPEIPKLNLRSLLKSGNFKHYWTCYLWIAIEI
jgi:hypothetical protein